MQKNKILTSPSSFGQVGKEPFEILSENGYEIINNPYGRRLTEDEVIELATDCIGIVAGVENLNQRVMDSLPHLKCISRVGVGMDNVDLDYAKKKGICVINTPDGPTLPVAELTLAMTMSLLRRIPMAHTNMKQGIWQKEIGNLLYGKTIGIIGLGRIGKKVATMFRALGNRVLGFDINPDLIWARSTGIEIRPFEEVLIHADIITLHVPGNKDISYLIDKKELALMKLTTFLINISRGGVVNEEELYNALKENRLAGAAVDVFSEEPYKGKLSELNNVVLTPHLGSYAEEAKILMEIDAVKNLIKGLSKT